MPSPQPTCVRDQKRCRALARSPCRAGGEEEAGAGVDLVRRLVVEGEELALRLLSALRPASFNAWQSGKVGWQLRVFCARAIVEVVAVAECWCWTGNIWKRRGKDDWEGWKEKEEGEWKVFLFEGE